MFDCCDPSAWPVVVANRVGPTGFERRALDDLAAVTATGSACSEVQRTRPQTVG